MATHTYVDEGALNPSTPNFLVNNPCNEYDSDIDLSTQYGIQCNAMNGNLGFMLLAVQMNLLGLRSVHFVRVRYSPVNKKENVNKQENFTK